MSEITILAPISVGELLDKITILQIKQKQAHQNQLSNIEKELNSLQQLVPILDPAINQLMRDMWDVNWRIWQAEDEIRKLDRQQQFDTRYIDLARLIHQLNDQRASIKRQINISTNSSIIEEKVY